MAESSLQSSQGPVLTKHDPHPSEGCLVLRSLVSALCTSSAVGSTSAVLGYSKETVSVAVEQGRWIASRVDKQVSTIAASFSGDGDEFCGWAALAVRQAASRQTHATGRLGWCIVYDLRLS